MRVRDLGTELVVDDRPALDRWIGVFNFVIAGACSVIALVHYRPGGDLRDVFLVLVAPFAAAVAAIALWRALARPATVLHVDGVSGAVTLMRRTVLRHEVSRWPAGQVARFACAQRPGQDGEPVYRLRLDLANGESLPAATVWHPDPVLVDAVISRANALLGK